VSVFSLEIEGWGRWRVYVFWIIYIRLLDGELDEFFFEDSIPLDGRRCFFVKLDPFAGLLLNSTDLQAFSFFRSHGFKRLLFPRINRAGPRRNQKGT